MLKKTERTIYYYDLVVKTRATHAKIPTIGKIAEVWKAAVDAGTLINKREQGNVIYRVGDIEIDTIKGTLCALIRRSDITASDAAYSHMENGTLRHIPKGDDEGGDTAAHLVISLLPESDKTNTYLCLLEGIPAISHRHIQPLLNIAISKACNENPNQFQYDDPVGARNRDGSPKKHPFTPRIELRGHLSDDAIKDLESGSVNYIELIEATTKSELGGDPYLHEDKHSLKIKVDKAIPSHGRAKRLLNAMLTKKTDFQKGRIVFKDEQNTTRTIEYDLNTGAPEQQNYIKCHVIDNITPPMAQSCGRLVSTFVSEIERKIIAERNC